LLLRKRPLFALYRRLGGPQSRYGQSDEEYKLPAPAGNRNMVVDPVTVLTELPWLHTPFRRVSPKAHSSGDIRFVGMNVVHNRKPRLAGPTSVNTPAKQNFQLAKAVLLLLLLLCNVSINLEKPWKGLPQGDEISSKTHNQFYCHNFQTLLRKQRKRKPARVKRELNT
jgi:hypothetical protein